MYEAYPLTWPSGYKRTPSYRRGPSRFKQTMGKAQQFLHDEISRLGGRELIVSTNLRLRQDGMIYATDLNKKIEDPGVAIYFKYKGKEACMCCDQYTSVWENIFALAKGIEALRGMDRWGVSEFLDRAFTGFTALPSSSPIIQKDIWLILGLPEKPPSFEALRAAYLRQTKISHPDTGGSNEAFQELQSAYNQALKFFN